MPEKNLRSKDVFGQRVTLCEVIENESRRYEIRLQRGGTYDIVERKLTRPAGIRAFEDFPGKRAEMIDRLQQQYADILERENQSL
jgi:hypothetical protein